MGFPQQQQTAAGKANAVMSVGQGHSGSSASSSCPTCSQHAAAGPLTLSCAQHRAAREQQASSSRSHSQSCTPLLSAPALLQIGPDYVDFDRPLSLNVSTSWSPEIHTWAAYTRTEVGIEKLTIECPWTAYAGMGKEQGWNALNFWWTPHSWVDDVSILNAGVAQQHCKGVGWVPWWHCTVLHCRHMACMLRCAWAVC